MQITRNRKHNYITVYGDNQIEKARDKDWICRADHGKIYVLDNKSFMDSYDEAE